MNRPLTRYTRAAVLLVILALLALRPLLAAADFRAVSLAGAVATAVQIALFGSMLHCRTRWNRFLVAWVGGIAVRAAVVVSAALVAVWLDAPTAPPMLLALAGFLFGLVLLEPVFLRRGLNETVEIG